ncbi:helix-turn-helix transcriptional regulator [Millisia brevis]|uniref:helix-turn-helix transcriptional regulator n=1 Tax=Millisia brevis TaxID=264148 RepID=UPI00082ECB23|nr:AraC family transcriptional regulator [Millisia brevis]
MQVDRALLERLLTDVEWTVAAACRPRLGDGAFVGSDGAAMLLVYVRSGAVDLLPTGIDTVCRPGRAETGALLVVRPSVRLVAVGEAELTVAGLRPTPGGVGAAAELPDWIVLGDLERSDPDIVGLAAGLGGCTGPADVSAVCGKIATAIVAVVLRTWVERGCAPQGWLDPIGDPYLARAVEAIHLDPGRRWTVADLARTAAMSRSAFAQRFRGELGVSPAAYLNGVRMTRAQQMLGRDGLSVTETSRLLGYASDIGFSRAFTRHVGSTPAAWRRDAG